MGQGKGQKKERNNRYVWCEYQTEKFKVVINIYSKLNNRIPNSMQISFQTVNMYMYIQLCLNVNYHSLKILMELSNALLACFNLKSCLFNFLISFFYRFINLNTSIIICIYFVCTKKFNECNCVSLFNSSFVDRICHILFYLILNYLVVFV